MWKQSNEKNELWQTSENVLNSLVALFQGKEDKRGVQLEKKRQQKENSADGRKQNNGRSCELLKVPGAIIQAHLPGSFLQPPCKLYGHPGCFHTIFFFLIRQVNESLLYSLIQCNHLSRSSLFPALTVLRSGCSKPDKFGQRAISLSFFFQIPFPSLDGLFEVQHRFYRVLLWSGYRIEQSLYNIHYLYAVNDRMQVLQIPYSAYMAMFQYCTHIQIIISMGIYKHT